MPKLIYAMAAWLFGPTTPLAGSVHAQTRSRDKTRRLRVSRIYEPYVDLSPLNLTRRH